MPHTMVLYSVRSASARSQVKLRQFEPTKTWFETADSYVQELGIFVDGCRAPFFLSAKPSPRGIRPPDFSIGRTISKSTDYSTYMYGDFSLNGRR